MATLTDYKGLDVVENATGDGGIALTDNFKELADRAPYQGSGNPGVNDDTTKGFSPGDWWLNTSTQVLWSCISNSTGAAVWKSVLKRTSTALELIPQETSETVQVKGNGQVDGKLGIGKVASSAPLEVQQNAHASGIRINGYDTQSANGGSLWIDPNGYLFVQASQNLYLYPLGGVTNVLGSRLAARANCCLTFDNPSTNVPQFAMGVEATAAKLQISTGSNLNSPKVTIDPANGYVGLGTASPGANLHVVRSGTAITPQSGSAIAVQNTYDAGGWGAINILGGNAGASILFLGDTDDTDVGMIFYNHSTDTLTSYANGAAQSHLNSTGLGIGTTPTAKLDVNSDKVRVRTAKTPSSASDTGNQGDICWDANYVYICVAANTWKRATLATW